MTKKHNKRYEPKLCPECGKQVVGEQGLWGHLALSHGIRRPKLQVRLSQQVHDLEAELRQQKKDMADLENSFRKKIAQLTNDYERQLTLKDMEISAEQKRYRLPDGPYCPKCGRLVSDHEVIHDLAWGDRYECP
jgi:ribosomal protein S27AE